MRAAAKTVTRGGMALGAYGTGPLAGAGGVAMHNLAIPGMAESWHGGTLAIARLRLRGSDAIEQPYTQHWLVHLCIRKRAELLSDMPLALWTDRSDYATKLQSHPILDLLARPNPVMGSRLFLKATEIYRLLDGECFWAKLDERYLPTADPIPAHLMPIRGSQVQAEINSRSGVVERYRYTGDATMEFSPQQIVRLSEFNPYDPVRGLGLAHITLRQADQDYQLDRMTDALVNNGGQPSIVLSSDQMLTPDQGRQAKEVSDEKLREGGTLILTQGLKPVNEAFTPVEMAFMEGRVWNRDAIIAAFGLNRVVLGFVEDINRATAQEAIAVALEQTIIPAAHDVEEQIQSQLVDVAAPGRGIVIGFDSSGMTALRASRDAQVARVKTWVDMGLTVQAAARLENIEDDIADADIKPLPPSLPAFPFEQSAPAVHRRMRLDMQDDRRAVAWHEYAAATRAQDNELQTLFAGAQRAYLRAVSKRVEDIAAGDGLSGTLKAQSKADVEAMMAALADLMPSDIGFADALKQPFAATMAKILDVQARTIARRLGKSAALFTAQSPAAAAFLGTKAIKVTEGTMSTLARFTRRQIAEALVAESYTVSSVAVGLRAQLARIKTMVQATSQQIDARAMTIAQTEAGAVANFSRVTEMRLIGLKRHEWVTSRDENVRDTHAPLDGQIVEIGAQFSNGLRWPNDPQGDAGEVINCRCTVVGVFDEGEE